MSEFKNPDGSYYLDSENFAVEYRETITGQRPVVKLAKTAYDIPDLSDKYISTNLKGQPNGVAELDEAGKLLSTQLPSGIDKAEEYSTREGFPEVGQVNIIYVDLATNLEYRWSGSTYVQIPTGLALGNTAETAFRGDHGEEIYLSTINGKPVRSSPKLSASDVHADPEGSAFYEANLPEHTTMIVEAYREGFGGYKANKSSKEILDHANAGGLVILRYTDNETNKTLDIVLKGKTTDRKPWFYQTFIIDNEIHRVDATVDWNKNVERIERIVNVPVIDDFNLSAKTTMSSIEIAKRLSCKKRLSGQSVTMYPVEGYPLDIVAEIHAVQNGSNTPSVINIRDISGWDNIMISIDNTLPNGHKDYNQQFDETVYGGTYDPNRGRLKITMGYHSFNGSEAWEKIDRTINGRTTIFKLNVAGLNASDNNMTQLCNIFKTGPISEAFSSDCVWAIGDEIYVGNGIVTQFGNNLTQFKNQLSQTNMQIVYELNQPKIKDFEPKNIVAIEGKNIITASTGDVDVSTQTLGCIEEEVHEVIKNYLQTPEGIELIKSIVNGQI